MKEEKDIAKYVSVAVSCYPTRIWRGLRREVRIPKFIIREKIKDEGEGRERIKERIAYTDEELGRLKKTLEKRCMSEIKSEIEIFKVRELSEEEREIIERANREGWSVGKVRRELRRLYSS
ncbi:MAG: hypothetical protein QIT33_gp13 [Methanophagales virus PBV300]|uniref:Uncharacterized protein n=1 Tax=Methanophagales virus PBV300 TaxID=2987731 RepID=A0ABY6GNN0_9VIRU|nr:MAG: hypothetical protein QIT33_gp13 [Methanophagales virus PBV300]UYL64975.1 MAG: hypothetical protein JBCDKDKM_00013 [Methanophagales virus PBV300]